MASVQLHGAERLRLFLPYITHAFRIMGMDTCLELDHPNGQNPMNNVVLALDNYMATVGLGKYNVGDNYNGGYDIAQIREDHDKLYCQSFQTANNSLSVW